MRGTRPAGFARHLLAILILPVNVAITLPLILLWATDNFGLGCVGAEAAAVGAAAAGGLTACTGLVLVGMTIHAFVTEGEGTLAPWDPTSKLVVVGIYRHTRNPMIAGVVLILAGEAVVFCSGTIGIAAAAFLVLNTAYFKLSEEPGLVKRFGADYETYRDNVPMWWPRMWPWTPPRT